MTKLMKWNKIMKNKKKISSITRMHFIKLLFRSLLFLIAIVCYVSSDNVIITSLLDSFGNHHIIFFIIWLVFFIEMVFRFFPSNIESMGCQKQFSKCFIKNNEVIDENEKKRANIGAIISLIAWLILNGFIYFLNIKNIISDGIMVLIALFYSVCDMVCILFFCPFQVWFMKNKCCNTCRIYNWDFAMMFTPLLFINNFYTRSLILCAIALVIRWEVTAFRHSERFFESTNSALACKNCKEKLCHQKTQLIHLMKLNKERNNIE